ncbi:MAG: phenylacetate--CoA ligase family protein [Deltaproteobacteria bacterium]|nr:phenylacetate--CoA ligase family protein [Deltaproteobacteria bacterium]
MAIDFRIRDFFYPYDIYKLRQTFEQTQWLPPEELQAYQEKRLTLTINHAYKHVPYYRRLFEKTGLRPQDIQKADDLKKLPLLSKDTIRKEGQKLVADNAKRYHPVSFKTSGTTGTPVEFCLDKSARILEFVYYWRHWSWAGYRLGDRFAELGSFYFLNRERLNDAVSSWQPHLRRLMLNSGQIAVFRARELAAAIRKYRPKYLKGAASTVYFLALCLKEAGINDISFKAIFSVNEVLTPQYRSMAEAVFNCPVLDSYGHMEGTVAISQCLEGGYHVNSDYGIMEFNNIKTSSDGDTLLGQAVGTSLYNLAMPLIRYDVGDDIELFAEPRTCRCGRILPLVKLVHGRSEDTIITPEGRFITSMFIVPEFTEGVRFVQFVQESKTDLYINVVPEKEWDDRQEEELAYYVTKLVGTGMKIHIHKVTQHDIVTDASGKIRSVISCVKHGFDNAGKH